MAAQILVRRMDSLEHRVEALETLPDRIGRLELQIVQFREEVRGEFSATRAELRAEMRTGDEETQHLMRALHERVIEQLRAEMKQGDDETQRLMRVLHERVIEQLRAEMKQGDDETQRLMRVLHEDVISRFAIVRESEPPSPRRVRSKSQRRSKR